MQMVQMEEGALKGRLSLNIEAIDEGDCDEAIDEASTSEVQFPPEEALAAWLIKRKLQLAYKLVQYPLILQILVNYDNYTKNEAT